VALVLVATVGSASANSYLTVAAAAELILERFNTDSWDDATNADREKALVAATRAIDRCRFRGFQATGTQSLAFPRSLQSEAVTVIPSTVQQACASQALFILQNSATGGTSKRKQIQSEGVSSFSVGNLSESYAPNSSPGGADHLCEEARDYLKRWISRTGTIIGQRETPGETRPWFPYR
jgi:hypothetical protein